MNQLANIIHTQELKMSSREIAELCNKRHNHVCRDIQKLNEHYESMGMPNFGTNRKDKSLLSLLNLHLYLGLLKIRLKQ